MNRETIIDKEISINTEHVNNFKLETSSGTKKMKEKFYHNAVKERNEYVKKQLSIFEKYQKSVYKLLNSRVNEILPSDKTKYYESCYKKNLEYKNAIILNNEDFYVGFKLGIFKLISEIDIDDDVSLNDINTILLKFIKIFNSASISLTSSDFTYSMFTEKYMSLFIENKGSVNFDTVMKKCFDDIYWECPDIIKHLKLNLWFLLDKYKSDLDKYAQTLANDSLNGFGKNIVSTYLEAIKQYDTSVARDEFYNLNMFLSKKKNILDYLTDSATRSKNFDQFVIDGSFKDIKDTSKFYDNMVDLAYTLSVLKSFYRYEFIIKDMQDKYNKRDSNKNLYEQKLKEIKTEESKKNKIYNNYLKSIGKNLFHKVDLEKARGLKLEMNGEINKISTLYEELHDLEIVEIINKKVSNISSLYDLFLISYNSYYYLEDMFKEHFKDEEGFSFEKELDKYFDFIYSPYNEFLKQINAFVSTSVSLVISDKFRLLGINVSSQDIETDSLDSFMDSVNYIKFIYDISKGRLSIENIYTIVKFREFDVVEIEDNSDEVI